MRSSLIAEADMVKRLLFLQAVWVLCFSTHAQGTIYFYNRDISGPNGTKYNAPASGDTSGFVAQLYLVTGSGASARFTPVAGQATFLPPPNPAYFTMPVLATVPNQVPGTTRLNFVVRVWKGPNYETATTSFQSGVFTVGPLGGQNPLGGPDIPPPDLGGPNGVGGISPSGLSFIFPEPSTYAIATIGVILFAAYRRK